MTNDPEKVDLASPDLAAAARARIEALFPGVLADSVLDATRLGELLGVEVTAPTDGRERYGLMWAGKAEAVRSLQTPSHGTLVPDHDRSVGWDTAQNVFVEGDNLEVLKLLQKAYNDRVKAIYIDPPYNTGNDFVYNDDFMDGLRGYLEYTGQVDESGKRLSTETDVAGGRRHSGWLSMMYPRLVLARNLLRQDGAIFVSIDDNEAMNLKALMDEVFGPENFVAQLTVLSNPKGRSQDKFFATNHDYVFVYTRRPLETGAFAVTKSDELLAADYPLKDENGSYRLLELRNTHREFGKHNRPNLYYPLYVGPDGVVTIDPAPDSTEVLPNWADGFEGCWTWGKEKAIAEQHLLVGRLVGGDTKVYRKAYAEGALRMLKTILQEKFYTTETGQRMFNEVLGTSGKVFQSPKSPVLLADLLETRTSGDDLILDFFAGSGSTAHAVAMLNSRDGGKRRWILVNLPEPTPDGSDAKKAGYDTVSSITAARIKAVRASVVGADSTGIRAVALRRSNFSTSTNSHELVLAATTLVDGLAGAEMAVASEALLKEGVALDVPWEWKRAGGADLVVAGGVAVVLTTDITDAVVSEALALKPRVLVFLEDGFAGRDTVKTNAFTNAKQAGIKMKTL